MISIKGFFSRMAVIALSMWLGFSAGVVNAGVPTMSSFDGSAITGYNASFWNTGVASSFDDWINFSIPSDSSGNGASNLISLGGSGLAFSAFNLYESTVLIATGITSGSSSYLSFTGGAVPGNYSLNIAGFKINTLASASYAGNITISPVPEPETYAMLVVGLGLLGFSARRRNNNA